MSSSLIYRAFGFRAYQVVQTSTRGGTLALSLRQDQRHDRCSHCQSANVIRHGAEERTFRTVPIGGKPVELYLPVPRLGCRDCGCLRQAAIGFAAPFRRFTHALERYALGLLKHMTIQAVAEHLKVGWDSIKTLFKRRLQARFGKPRLKRVRRIAIDEISIGHGHRYLTVVLDLDTGAVIFIGRGKGAVALAPFWERLQ